MRFPHGPGFGFLGGVFESILAGLVFIICFLVLLAILFVFVRFLLVATKAAELYVANNTPKPTVTPVATKTVPATTTTTTRARTTKPPSS